MNVHCTHYYTGYPKKLYLSQKIQVTKLHNNLDSCLGHNTKTRVQVVPSHLQDQLRRWYLWLLHHARHLHGIQLYLQR